MKHRQPYLLEGENETAQYWVVRGKSTEAHFHEALDGNEEWMGPFADYETARQVWAKRAGTPITASEICYRIERIDIEAPPNCTD